jgi:hypothetical protein
MQWKDYCLPAFLSVPFSVLGLLTIIKSLEIINLVNFQPIYRVTYPVQFLIFLTGNFLIDDLLIVLVGVAASVAFFYRNKILLFAVSGFFLSLTIAAVFVFENLFMADMLALSIFPAISVLYVTFGKRLVLGKQITKESLILSAAWVFSAVEILSLFSWIIYPAFPSRIYSGTWQWYGAELEAKLFHAFGYLSPILIVLLIFSFGLKPALASLKQWQGQDKKEKTTSLNEGRSSNFASPILTIPSDRQDYSVSRKIRLTFLSISIFLAVALSIYPYLPSINRDFQSLSVDAPYYVNQINLIKNHGLFAENSPINLSNERALSILVFYGIATLVNQPTTNVVAFLPIFIGTLTVFSTYFLVRHAFGSNSIVVLIAPLLAALSSQFIVGIYGGFFSNMLALPISFAAILFFLRYLDSRKWPDFALFTALMMLTMLAHLYTWVFLVATMTIATGILLFMQLRTEKANSSNKNAIRLYLPVILAIASSVLVLLSIGLLIKGTSGLENITNLTSSRLSGDYFAEKWFNISYTFKLYLGGFLTNSAMILLALVWALKADYKNTFNVVLLSSMFLASFFFFFGDAVTQSRIFYEIPLQIPAAIVLAGIARGGDGYLSFASSMTRLAIVILILLHLANYALRSLANFYLILP